MIFIDKQSATEGKKLLESHLLNVRNGKKVSVGLIIQLACKVVQQKIRHTILFFSVMAGRCMCGILSWIVLFIGSMFFATKIVYSTKHSCKKSPVPVPECLLDTIPEQQVHRCRHQTALVRPVPKPTPISHDAFYDCVEESLPSAKKELKSLEHCLPPVPTPILKKPETVEPKPEPVVLRRRETVPSMPATQKPAPLERRLSNVERFLKESSPVPEMAPRENSRFLLGIVYSSCALVAVQFYVLMAALLSSNIPFGLMFLVVCLSIIVALITQICFYRKLDDKVKVTRVSRKRRRESTSETESESSTTTKEFIRECERRGKPVAPVKPFLRIPSTKELFSGIEGLKNTASDLLKKKKL
ncbi:uncharacterized protein LOC134831841 [Culicoides brevitarsis]|uniref:uncharacterized protein LOC134831841 n=1 Tax=Culicoides brevitarsis TaxID=469753 RepID=UPI00307C6ABA